MGCHPKWADNLILGGLSSYAEWVVMIDATKDRILGGLSCYAWRVVLEKVQLSDNKTISVLRPHLPGCQD